MTIKKKHLENIDLIVVKAKKAFWEMVAESIPEAETGDLSPIAECDFGNASLNAVKEWIENNVPEPKFKKVTQLRIDIAHNDIDEVKAFYRSIQSVNANSEFDLDIVDDGNAPYTEDMTDAYKSNNFEF